MSVFAALFLCLLVAVGGAVAYQVQTASSGTGPIVKTYPSTLTATHTYTGSVSAFSATAAFSATGVPLATYYTPQIPLTTNATDLDVNASGCVATTARCSNRGTLTITFNKPVTNPVIHFSGFGGNQGTTRFHTSLNLTNWVATGTPTLSLVSGNSNFAVVNGNEIRSTAINGAVSCQANPAAGCGSVRVNGTVTSVTFRADLLMAGTGTSSAAAADGFTYTVTVDEDFGDAPPSFNTSPVASHVVGGLFLGGSITADNTTTVNGNPQTTSPLASANASSDGSDNGVAFPALIRGIPTAINVNVTGTGGILQGWIDWNDNGTFVAGEQIATNAVDGGAGDADGIVNGVIRVNVTPPLLAALTPTIARFRISTVSGLGSNGAAPDGEVEDYEVAVVAAAADLSLTKTVSTPTPLQNGAVSFTLTVTNAAGSSPTTGVQVRDTLPAGFTFTNASTPNYNSGTGIWNVGNLAGGASATLTINGTASGAIGSTVTNIAQVSASGVPDPDSTPNNNAAGEDDYATAAYTIAGVFNCPQGSIGTGSGFANGGTGLFQQQIFWLDWNCSGVTNFPEGSIINKSWDAGDGLIINGQVTNIANGGLNPYTTGSWQGDRLNQLYPGVNPIGLGVLAGGVNDRDLTNFRLSLTGTLNGVSVPLRYVAADAEDTGTAGAEQMRVTTSASPWTVLETSPTISSVVAGTTATWNGTAAQGNGTFIYETSGSSVAIDAAILANNGGQSFAFGVFTPFDFSDAPLTGTSYGSANHRTIGNYILGASVTTEAVAYDTPNADGDVDNGVVTATNFLRGSPATVNVNVQGLGRLSGWIDFNDDGDWADAGEKVATDLIDGGAGDLDGLVNGVIQFQVTPPLTAASTPTIARLRYSSRANAPSSGLWGFGEVEDYQITILTAELTVAKTSIVVSDPFNMTTNQKRIPGATVRYCILVTNTGTVTADNVEATDDVPAGVIITSGTIRTGTTCAGAADAEDDNDTGPDETNPFGASIVGAQIKGIAPSLSAGGTFAIVFDSIVQ